MAATFGADINNLFNHPLFSPDATTVAVAGHSLYSVTSTSALIPQRSSPFSLMSRPNPDFGRLDQTFTQDGVDSRRTIRLLLRITF